MSYHDLPDDVRSRPLTDATLQSDVVDLVLGVEDRRAGALAVVLCDEGDRGFQPIVLSDLGGDATVADLVRLLDLVLPLVGDFGGSVLLARGRRRGLAPSDGDRAWHQATIDACRRHRVRLLGFHLAAPEGVEALPVPLAAGPSRA
jgi:hypothetical protein